MAKTPPPAPRPSDEALDQFVREWGRMSSSWGINRTMAQIHALLLGSGRPFSVDEIMERLHISRGNASMNLRDLMDWGIIYRYRNPGDRKDVYMSHDDPWTVFARVARERKRREIDPTVAAIRDCLTMLPPDASDMETTAIRARLEMLVEIFNLIDRVFQDVMSTDQLFQTSVDRFRADELPEETT